MEIGSFYFLTNCLVVGLRDKSGGRAKIPCEDEEFFLYSSVDIFPGKV